MPFDWEKALYWARLESLDRTDCLGEKSNGTLMPLLILRICRKILTRPDRMVQRNGKLKHNGTSNGVNVNGIPNGVGTAVPATQKE